MDVLSFSSSPTAHRLAFAGMHPATDHPRCAREISSWRKTGHSMYIRRRAVQKQNQRRQAVVIKPYVGEIFSEDPSRRSPSTSQRLTTAGVQPKLPVPSFNDEVPGSRCCWPTAFRR
jgi:hypothetical protein